MGNGLFRPPKKIAHKSGLVVHWPMWRTKHRRRENRVGYCRSLSSVYCAFCISMMMRIYEFLEMNFEIFLLWILLVRRFMFFIRAVYFCRCCCSFRSLSPYLPVDWRIVSVHMIGLNYSFYIKIISCVFRIFGFYDFSQKLLAICNFLFLVYFPL